MAAMIHDFEILKFGKYKSRNINDILKEDIEYCRWMFTQPTITDSVEIYEILNNRFRNDGNIYLKFGKYKNKSIDYILNEKKDLKYIHYLQNNIYFKNNYPNDFKEIMRIKL